MFDNYVCTDIVCILANTVGYINYISLYDYTYKNICKKAVEKQYKQYEQGKSNEILQKATSRLAYFILFRTCFWILSVCSTSLPDSSFKFSVDHLNTFTYFIYFYLKLH